VKEEGRYRRWIDGRKSRMSRNEQKGEKEKAVEG
jgi:hypothetical protein